MKFSYWISIFIILFLSLVLLTSDYKITAIIPPVIYFFQFRKKMCYAVFNNNKVLVHYYLKKEHKEYSLNDISKIVFDFAPKLGPQSEDLLIIHLNSKDKIKIGIEGNQLNYDKISELLKIKELKEKIKIDANKYVKSEITKKS